MLEVFPDGLAVCRQNAGNKTLCSSIIQLVSKPHLPFLFYLGYLTSNSTKIFLTRMLNCFFMSVSAKQIIRLNYYSLTQDCNFHRKNIQVGNNGNCSNNNNSWRVICTKLNDHNNRDRNTLYIVVLDTRKPVLT